MPSVERTVTVDRPLSAVWAYLSDFTNTTEWDPGTVRTTRASGGGEVGTVYSNTSSFLGKESDLEYTVTDLVPEQKFQLRGVNKTVTAVDTMTFSGDANRTTVTYLADFTFKGIASLLSPLMVIPLKKLGDEAEQGMRESLLKL